MRYLLFGTGDCYERYKRWFCKNEIVALIDNSVDKQGKKLDGYEVISPAEGIQREFDAVIILSFYVRDMRAQLESLGVTKEKIYHFYDLHRLIDIRKNHKELSKYGDFTAQKGQKKILLLNQNLSIGGPAFTLFDCARILKKNGYYVAYGAMVDGPLREKILQENIPVIVDENLLVGTMKDSLWVQEYDVVICNAINFYVFLSDRDTAIPTIWWLHDSKFFYEGVDKQIISRISELNLRILAVGNVPKMALREYAPELKVETLLYGVKEDNSYSKMVLGEAFKTKIILNFITIGFVEARKGQDILVEAVMLLPQYIKKQCRFYIVGENSSMLAKTLEDKARDIPELIFTGVVEDVHKYLKNADVLICPSREDPMPAVCTEAMMHELPCLVSDAIGTAAYIQEKKNGLLFQNGNIEELARQIVWCVEKRQELTLIGKKSRKIFENNFSMDIFEKNLLEVIENI
ncbi:MAG: glycosyltransferase family 4 protein [Dorea sp.]|jgi:glycosyltransferase involved in cell wall biosynthesis|nr:glycosyltransferase family 4 protein [Dorea sp.]